MQKKLMAALFLNICYCCKYQKYQIPFNGPKPFIQDFAKVKKYPSDGFLP